MSDNNIFIKGDLEYIEYDGSLNIKNISTNLSSSGEVPVINVDSELSLYSTNPVQNKVVTQRLNEIQHIAVDSDLSLTSSNPVQNKAITQKLKNMVGCSEYEEGESGFVPAPPPGSENKFLRGDGKWVEIKAYNAIPVMTDVISIFTSDDPMNKQIISGTASQIITSDEPMKKTVISGNAERLDD